jgi:hypothetical protein
MKAIPSDNYVVRPYVTHKPQSYTYTFATSSVGNPTQIVIDIATIPNIGTSYTSSMITFNPATAVINSSSGIYQVPLYASVKNLLYRSGPPYNLAYFYTPQENQFYVMSIAQKAYGEGIQPNSITITSPASTASLFDDGNGNIITKSPVPIWIDNFNRNDTVAGVVGSASVGLAQTGQAYTYADTSNFQQSASIQGGRLVFPSSSVQRAIGGDLGLSDYTFSFTLASASVSASGAWGAQFRVNVVGNSTYAFTFQRLFPGSVRLQRADNAGINPTGITMFGVSDGETLTAVCAGSAISIYRTGSFIATYNIDPIVQAGLMTGTKFQFYGLAGQATAFDDFSVYAPYQSASMRTAIATSSIWVDNFNRPDGPVGLATSGQAYYSSSIGTWSISGSQLVTSGTTPEAIGGDLGTPNIMFSISTYDPGTELEYRFRYTDANNYMSMYLYYSSIFVRAIVGGAVVYNASVSPINTIWGLTAQHKFIAFGNRVEFYTAGTLVYTYFITDPILLTGTKFYLYKNIDAGGGSRYVMDNLSIDSYTTYSVPPPSIGSVNYGLGLIALKQFTGSFSSSIVTDAGCYFNTGSQVNVKFNATQTIYEHQVICTMDAGEFNYSTNPSVTSGSSSVSGTGRIIDMFATQSLTPYMTTVGCYTNRGELVALGKFPRPIKRAPDTQQTVIVRFDI